MAAEAVAGLLESRIDHDLPFDIPVFREKKDYYAIPLEPNLSFALWLRFQRKAHKMTLADAAEKMGVKYQVYQKLENPRTANPTLKTLSRIERVFNTELVTI
jgi:antitoxin HicB